MTLELGETAPDFEAETTEGTIRFHDEVRRRLHQLAGFPQSRPA